MKKNEREHGDEMLVIALYKFVSLPDYHEIQQPLLNVCVENGITGTILLAEEGLNGTVAGRPSGIEQMLAFLRNDERLSDIEYKRSYVPDDHRTFYRMKVRLKKEIVTMGVEGVDPTKQVGTYVQPEEWNDLISDPDVIVIDTRNDYEIGIGTFEGAIDPQTKTFREFPDYVAENLNPDQHKKIAMFCTGGIRCEKATSYMLEQGFKEVYHLKGGILNYLERVPEDESKWSGDCFVFDNRTSVNHHLEPGEYSICYACRRPLSEEDLQSPDYEKGVSCSHCIKEYSAGDRVRFAERQKQVELSTARNENHIGG